MEINNLAMNRFLSIKKLFLFATIVLLPILVTYYSITNLIEEQYYSTIETISNNLKQQVADIELNYKDEHQIEDFLSILIEDKKICQKKPEIIKDFITKLDKLYPDAFNWLFLDKNYEIIPINSKLIISGGKFWQQALESRIYVEKEKNKGNPLGVEHKKAKQFFESGKFLQKWLGKRIKYEHIFQNPNKVHKANWLNKECYIIWRTDGLLNNQFSDNNSGLCLLMIFPKKLPDNIWTKRLVIRRKTSSDNYKFPIAAINISKNTSFILDSELPQDEYFSKNLIKAYNKRVSEIFNFSNYLVGTTITQASSEIRILSMADISEQISRKSLMQLLLKLACFTLFLISILLAIYIKNIHFAIISLQQRIAIIFLVAMILPVLSLISIGIIYISHEEKRLKESALVKMRSTIEALSIRYRDTPRIIEEKLFDDLKKKFTKPPYTPESISINMKEAVEEKFINQFILFDENGIASTSWTDMDSSFKTALKYMSDKFISYEKNINLTDKKDLLNSAVTDEMTDVFNSFGWKEFDFSRPSHLRHFVGMDTNLYFMAIEIIINNKIYPLFVYVSDILVEKEFARHEFLTNNPVTDESSNKSNRIDNELSKKSIIPELSFYSTLGYENFPPDDDPKNPIPHWKELYSILYDSSKYKIEKSGSVTIEGEKFLYLTKPLYSMYSKSYQPCLLTSTKPIDRRIYDARILLFTLSSFAIIGSILLSLLLSSSLLVPIMKIDSAAQQIGKGNLDVVLPEETKDELGRLSMTFNAMVKGLRERARMRAYVSDSVLEAVKDNSDQSVHAGKNIEATILFSDIRNFTGISEANTPNRIFEVLNEFLGGVEPIIHANHGRVDKFIGDAVMAIFHHTEPEHHAKCAIKAAVKMKSFVAIMNEDRKKRGLFPIEIGIGISTGLVLLGDVGSRYRKDLTVIGDEVNLASRLETASKQGKHSKIIFSGQTLKFIEDFVEAEKMPFEEIRGKKNAVQIYEFIKFKDQNDIS